MNHQRKNFKNFLLYLFIITLILKPCLGSLEIKNEFETYHILYDQEVQDNPESLQDDSTNCDFLSDSYDTTRMLGYAILLRYTAGKNISNMKHPLAKNLCILFNFFSEPKNDKNKVQQTIKELYELLENEENRNCSYEEKEEFILLIF